MWRDCQCYLGDVEQHLCFRSAWGIFNCPSMSTLNPLLPGGSNEDDVSQFHWIWGCFCWLTYASFQDIDINNAIDLLLVEDLGCWQKLVDNQGEAPNSTYVHIYVYSLDVLWLSNPELRQLTQPLSEMIGHPSPPSLYIPSPPYNVSYNLTYLYICHCNTLYICLLCQVWLESDCSMITTQKYDHSKTVQNPFLFLTKHFLIVQIIFQCIQNAVCFIQYAFYCI